MKKNKIAIAFSIFLMFAMAISLVGLPNVSAQDEKKTYAYIGAIPNPVGVGQEVLLHVGITQELQSVEMGWDDLSVTIEHPDGHIETIDGIRTDATGGTGRTFTPTEEGVYYIQSHFPEQVTTATKGAGSIFTGYIPEGTVMLASDSEKLELVVQAEQVEYHAGAPLPSEYWTRPIDAQLREWSLIAGNWIWGSGTFGGNSNPNRYAPYNDDAPETAHILWTTSMTTGGVAGGANPGSYSTGDAYEGKFPGPLIIAGKLYYTTGGSRGLMPVIYHCIDLHTGEELWTKTFLDNRTLSFGQVFFFDSFNYHGAFSYLYVTEGGVGFMGPPSPETWYAFDPATGDWRFTVNNVPSGTTLRDAAGGLYRLHVDQTNGWMALWNFSALVQNSVTGPDRGSWGNSVQMKTFNATANTAAAQLAWSWNKTIPTDLPGSVQVAELGDKVVGGAVTTTNVVSWALSLEDGSEGRRVYNTKTWNAPSEWASGNLTVSWAGSSIEDNVFVVWVKETREHYGFSTETGEYLWKTDPQFYLDYHVATENAIVDGKLFSVGVSGIVYCYDVTSGDELWTYEITDPYQEILWANNWWGQILFLADGKIYIGHSEHSPLNPLPRGAPFVCLNMTTGEVIFRADGLFRQTHWGGTAIIGDSIIATQDSYDQRVYAVGKGPSQTTVMASPADSVNGDSVVVSGMITDISPGTEEYALTARFPNGVPAVCDANMSDWMLYVYKQFAKPADVLGVNVTITVIDPNENYYRVATATSDDSGYFGCTFEPAVPGFYKIIATFEGSGAYYGSHAETFINVEEVPESTPTPSQTPTPMTDAYVLGIGAGSIIAIIAIGLVIILMLRKR
jgi:outer membrane protein assembly factor BamB